jgi:hypothetical protein
MLWPGFLVPVRHSAMTGDAIPSSGSTHRRMQKGGNMSTGLAELHAPL